MKLNVVVPFYNEAECAQAFMASLIVEMSRLEGFSCTYILVDDGSSDGTGDILEGMAGKDPRIRVVRLWGNHGHQKAVIAGLDQCNGDLILMMDGDGQHPPKIAVELVRRAIESPAIPVVQAVRRGHQQSLFKDTSSRLFYACINRLMPETRIEPGASDFRVLRREVLDLLRRYPDRYRNLRVLLASLGLPTLSIQYDVLPRLGGRSKYDVGKMLRLASDGLFAFSGFPLRVCLFSMALTGVSAMAYLLYVLAVYLHRQVVPGWTSIIALILLLFTVVFAVLAVLAEYIRRIYEDVRGHPVYRVRLTSVPNEPQDITMKSGSKKSNEEGGTRKN